MAENLGRGRASGPEMRDAEIDTCREGTGRELQPLDLGCKKVSESRCYVKRRDEATLGEHSGRFLSWNLRGGGHTLHKVAHFATTRATRATRASRRTI